ncbi:MAG TPA: VacJ family lipoprotein [Burkholderiales bacterium]|nr:VacJ family lipoprotein [Burkholderiales bacterium]
MKGIILLLGLIVAGCAATGDRDPRDPWEPMNRAVYKFNDVVDEAVAKPVARAYRKALHSEIRARIGNFFSNLADPFIGVNNFLQGKLEEGFQDWVRFAFNSTIGLLGIHDVASDMGYEKHNEDFGQTFGRWGAGSGPYLMLPFFGPSNVRDGVGFALDSYVDPMQVIDPSDLRTALYGTRLIDTRAGLLDASSLMEEAALDRYIFLRDAYLQRRRSLIYDGRPPRDPER